MIDHLWAQRITRCGGGVVRVPLGWSAERARFLGTPPEIAPTFCAADAHGPARSQRRGIARSTRGGVIHC
jgi:hypothetical protein